MIDSTSKILLTVSRGKYLVRQGVYKEAKINVKNSFSKEEKMTITEPMKTVVRPEYKEATQVITLSYHFIKHALERPIPPEEGLHRWLRSPMGKLAQNWKHASFKEKIEPHLQEIAEHLGGKVKSWEVI